MSDIASSFHGRLIRPQDIEAAGGIKITAGPLSGGYRFKDGSTGRFEETAALRSRLGGLKPGGYFRLNFSADRSRDGTLER